MIGTFRLMTDFLPLMTKTPYHHCEDLRVSSDIIDQIVAKLTEIREARSSMLLGVPGGVEGSFFGVDVNQFGEHIMLNPWQISLDARYGHDLRQP